MPDGPDRVKSPIDETERILRELQRQLQRLGDVYDRMGDLLHALRGTAPVRNPGGYPVPALLQSEARPSPASELPRALLLKAEEDLDGTFLITIDARKPMPLTKALAQVLLLLAADTGRHVSDRDPFVGWKSWDSLPEKLGIEKHAAIARLSRLRNHLERHGFERRLIQSSKNFGVRFGLIRKGALVTTGDSL